MVNSSPGGVVVKGFFLFFAISPLIVSLNWVKVSNIKAVYKHKLLADHR